MAAGAATDAAVASVAHAAAHLRSRPGRTAGSDGESIPVSGYLRAIIGKYPERGMSTSHNHNS